MPSADAIKQQIELLFGCNRLPLRVTVVPDRMGYVVLVPGHVPEQFQGAIHQHILRSLGLLLISVNMCWYRNGGTIIELFDKPVTYQGAEKKGTHHGH